ncbi:MAG: hypothetical protein RR957_07545, partial [Oscillospiraceae bacterium]
MKTKKILSLLVVLSVIAQMFGLLPVVNAAGDIPSEVAVVDVSSLKDSYVTAGAFTNNGMVDVAAEMTTGYIVPKTVTAGTAPSYNAELKRYEGNFASTGSVNYYRLPFDSAVRRDQISKSNKFTNGGYTIESYFKIQNAAGANNGIFDAAFGGG